jgi:hypothetical protein
MSIHYFHCTDGIDLILDRDGHETAGYRETTAWARLVAARIMRAVPTYDEWAGWAVHVYDAHGQVEIIPFEDELLRRAA